MTPTVRPKQIFDLHRLRDNDREATHWSLRTQPDAIDIDLAALATAAGVDVG